MNIFKFTEGDSPPCCRAAARWAVWRFRCSTTRPLLYRHLPDNAACYTVCHYRRKWRNTPWGHRTRKSILKNKS